MCPASRSRPPLAGNQCVPSPSISSPLVTLRVAANGSFVSGLWLVFHLQFFHLRCWLEVKAHWCLSLSVMGPGWFGGEATRPKDIKVLPGVITLPSGSQVGVWTNVARRSSVWWHRSWGPHVLESRMCMLQTKANLIFWVVLNFEHVALSATPRRRWWHHWNSKILADVQAAKVGVTLRERISRSGGVSGAGLIEQSFRELMLSNFGRPQTICRQRWRALHRVTPSPHGSAACVPNGKQSNAMVHRPTPWVGFDVSSGPKPLGAQWIVPRPLGSHILFWTNRFQSS